ncbi:CaiB/BaiF CoA-transferase family protein [Microbacterium sp. SLBN-146]|uniref:CaiB/BaiF CoA transferase family protein n=1 Tax=Microbacterium sp. SLBN-146 TaxID=2768457 RepID=UPI0011503B9D|nr:CoA transferase [Microbacterium sp. SLBN-146]TQJ29908.1 crotonobetainyl-CoA:carnitine CoA-transferase CaiB-like acyl-CoA transferase [Microbacterium sp. SLBN-146]
MRPLQDVRILAIEQYGAGPWGSVHLADLGAEIIKIEDPRVGGDVGRYVPPYNGGEDSLFFEAFNRNKRSISLDLMTPAGRQVFEDLVRESDVVYSNLRGDVPAKMKILYDDLKHLNPAIVCCSLTGFGMTGPRSTEPGYDYVLQGLAGWMDITGEPGGPPVKSGLSLVDFTGGFVAAISLLAALHAARRDGIGTDCDVSLYDTAISLLNYPAAWHLNEGYEPHRTRHSAHPSLVPFQAFETADSWIIIGCAKEKFWVRLAHCLGHSEWVDDPRFATFAERREHRDELIPLIEDIIRTRRSAEWLDDLRTAGIPSGPINTVADALTDPHTLARDLVVDTDHPRWGTLRQVASPVRVGTQKPQYRRAPLRNEDFSHVLEEIAGYAPERVDAARAAGAFGALETTRS